VLEALEDRVLPRFAAPVSYNVGTQATPFNGSVGADGVAVGDFNGDGKPDLAVVHGADGTVNILLNKGDGTFKPPVSYATGTVNPLWVTVGDFNGDGKLDLAVMGSRDTTTLDGRISILLGNGDGTFKTAVTYASGSVNRGGIAVGDFLGNGRLDLAVAQFGSISSTQSAVDIFLNNGDGTFKPYYTVGVPLAARSVTAGDFNGDGKVDLAVADGVGTEGQSGSTAGVTILLGNGDGTFTTAGQYASPPTPGDGIINPEFVTAGDLRNNGKTDLVVSDYDHNVNVFLGNGDGTFQPAVGYDTGEYPVTWSLPTSTATARRTWWSTTSAPRSRRPRRSARWRCCWATATARSRPPCSTRRSITPAGWRSATSTATACPTSRSRGSRTATPST
jgi:hypothetical protein